MIGAFRDLVPLTEKGIAQVEARVKEFRPLNIDLILSSPMTRSLQTAAILSRRLDLPLEVHFDLHEWLPDMTFQYDTVTVIMNNFDEMIDLGGEWPPGETRDWEPYSAVRKRVTSVLEQYTHYDTVLVACHAAVIQALTGEVIEMADHTTFELA